jgi:hypothetical protein
MCYYTAEFTVIPIIDVIIVNWAHCMERVDLYLIFAGMGAFIGALITPLVYWAKGRKPASGFFAGVFVGAFGNLICLIPFWLLIKPRIESKSTSYFDVAVAYNLGVAAVLGRRYEEARYYFVQVTQSDARNIGAWLYLANISTTPLEAWSFIQQARAINPAHPGVSEATTIVWPQVSHLYADTPPEGLPRTATNAPYSHPLVGLRNNPLGSMTELTSEGPANQPAITYAESPVEANAEDEQSTDAL